jgi:glutathione synthase/RimK-type ligase-like ATP-grasp enzyme
MWRYGFGDNERRFAKRLLPAIEHGLSIPVFPNWETSWHFEDKITQGYLLEAAGIRSPTTWTFWERDDALEFCRAASYPFVAKLTAGIRSNNVVLVHDRAQAERLISRMFGAGVETFHLPQVGIRQRIGRTKLIRRLRGRSTGASRTQSGYFYAQEYLPGNAFDTRVTVIGNRAFAFRRFNREGDFRASGSGRISWEPSEIDLATLQLAFEVADKLQTQSVAIDGMRRGDTRLVGEISYTYAAWAIERCPGHWARDSLGRLRWVEGPLRAEDAIFEDFVRGLGLK